MSQKSFLEVSGVWLVTGMANLVGYVVSIVEYLPVIQHIVTILSLLAATIYTLLKIKRDWESFNVWNKKGPTEGNDTNKKKGAR